MSASSSLFDIDPWLVGTDRLSAENVRLVESITSIGNGHVGMRGNFEEGYGGDSHQGTYLAGVWFPDRTRVGWWKNGYPEYFGKVVNATNLIAIGVTANGEPLDLASAETESVRIELDMRSGMLTRSFLWRLHDGSAVLDVRFERYADIVVLERLEQRVRIRAVQGEATVSLLPAVDGDVRNLDSNYGERFWEPVDAEASEVSVLTTRTVPNPFGVPRFTVTAGMSVTAHGASLVDRSATEWTVSSRYDGVVRDGSEIVLEKSVAVVTSRDVDPQGQAGAVATILGATAGLTWERRHERNVTAWAARWLRCDVAIEGDDATQQGIRYNLFQLFSTYYGHDPRLNIGPKGFTGEKYGGATYWDTEAYLVPFYLAVAEPRIALNLLRYRHDQLPQAKHNAGKQGLAGALYPMVTFTGIECHNEWEITFEEIHRNGAIAWAIAYYTEFTGDRDYIEREGYEVLTEISRFWADRVHFSERAQKYMIHGVTGPNEYENNVNNNWYTNYLAAWTLTYTADLAESLAVLPAPAEEIARWREIAAGMYLPYDAELGIPVQHDTYLDKDLTPAAEIPASQRPLNQHWSWDRILRSPYIKQADVLQGMYFFDDRFSTEEIRRAYAFYEPLTVHESSLSPSIHAIIAARVHDYSKAASFATHTARLDLDNVNNDTEDGLHITSMSGSWLAMVQGLAGLSTHEGHVAITPYCPAGWDRYTFTITHRGSTIATSITGTETTLTLTAGPSARVTVVTPAGERTVEVTGTVTVPTA